MSAGWKRCADGSVRLAIPIPESSADKWARIILVAALLQRSGCNLNDEVGVVRALHGARLVAADFMDVLDEAVDLARDAQGNEE